MSVPAAHPALEPRSAAVELHAQAAALRCAAQGLRDVAAVPGSAPAAAATLGCVEECLTALSGAIAAMRDETARAGADEVRRDMQALVEALDQARDTSGRAREQLGPVLARITLL